MPAIAPTPRRRASTVVVHEGKILTINATDPATGRRYLFIPGGAIEEGETPAEAAARETLEESGYSVMVDHNSELVLEYCFPWSGKEYACTTHFFAARLISTEPQRPTFEPGMGAPLWVPLSEIDRTFDYHPTVLLAVRRLIEARPSQ